VSILNVSHVSHGFGDRKIFEDISFRLLKGDHVGLIGANGEGKSTFMSIITDKLMPDEGTIEWATRVRVGYMDQHAVLEKGQTIRDALRQAYAWLFAAEEEMNGMYAQMADASEKEMDRLMTQAADLQDMLENSDFYMIDAKVDEVSRGLGLFELGLDKDVSDLSGGQRTKILLGKLLLQNPDVLLLDEPTNFLDEEQIIWLKQYLLGYENAFILISHDMEFLNEVVNLVYHVENAGLTRYVGNYDEFLRLYEQAKRQLEAAYDKQQAEIAGLQDFIARNKARVATANMAKSRQKKLDKMDVIALSREKPKPEFNFMLGRTPDKLVFQAEGLVIGYEADDPLSRPMDLMLERGMRVALVGANGIGKTTLLRSFLGEIAPLAGAVTVGGNQMVGYFKQEDLEGGDQTCIEHVWAAFPAFTQYEVRRALAKCGLTTQQLESRVKVLSGGEQAKVRLCKIINRETNILVLDEPTNHLDVDAKDELKRALQAYKGTILMVCHEPAFYEDIVTAVWDLKQHTLRIC